MADNDQQQEQTREYVVLASRLYTTADGRARQGQTVNLTADEAKRYLGLVPPAVALPHSDEAKDATAEPDGDATSETQAEQGGEQDASAERQPSARSRRR